MYRKTLRRFVEKPIDYLEEKDSTLLGSRSGIASVCAWSVINRLGHQGFKNIIKNRQNKLKLFVKECKKIKSLSVIWDKNSLSCGLVLKRKNSKMAKFLKKYGLKEKIVKLNINGTEKKLLIANVFFLN